MSLPKRIVFPCPLCEQFLEAEVGYFQISVSQDEDENVGVEADLSAFARHDCFAGEGT